MQILHLVPLCIGVFLLTGCTTETKKKIYDSRAIDHLDQLTKTMSELKRYSFSLEVIEEVDNKTTRIDAHKISIQKPKELHIHTKGADGERAYWYNGNQLSYHSYEKNLYDTLQYRGNIIDMIDAAHHKYDIDFPAADFLYPSLTDDIIDAYTEVYYMGDTTINQGQYTLIYATSATDTLEIWLGTKTHLPYKLELRDAHNYYQGYSQIG